MKGRGLAAALFAVALSLSASLPAQAAAPVWPTYHQDVSRTGNDTSEPGLTAPANRFTSALLDGDVYAEPLVFNHQVLVATENNSVYALDAASGNVIWQTNMGAPVPSSSLPCGNINPVGITGTPVIDTASNALFAVGLLAQPTIHYEMWALDLTRGSLIWRQQINPSPGGGLPAFDATSQGQRGALGLANGRVYIPFGGRLGDCGIYRGWVVGASAYGPGALVSFELPTPNNGGGIWAPSGVAIDGSGNVWATTGNTFCSGGCPFDYGNTVVKLDPNLAFLDYFAPPNWSALNFNDIDLGSVGPTFLSPNGLIFQVGKEGVGYLLNSVSPGGGNKTTAAYSARVCSQTNNASFGGTAYANGYLYVPCSDALVALTVNTGAPSFAAAWSFPVTRAAPPIVAAGLVWIFDNGNGNIYGLDPTTGNQVFTNHVAGAPHFVTPAAGDGRIFVAASRRLYGFGPFAVSTQQYQLTGSNGTTWTDIDTTNLRLAITPAANSTAILSGNADLWTAQAGFNQDIAISVSSGGGPDTIVAWKESGGSNGTFSPNAALVQTVFPMTAATTYVIKLKWKTNIPAPGATIFAGAGLGPIFSPTVLTAHLLPAGTNPSTAVSTNQFHLANSDGATWTDLDSSSPSGAFQPLSLSFTPGTSTSAVITGNADLWTAQAGFNQDLGIFVSGGAYGAGQIVAWKESGGFAGTFSPNAAFVHTVIPVAAATTYNVKLQWKANKNTSGATIYAAAGAGPSFSPTRLTAELMPASSGVLSASSNTQYVLTGSNAVTWQDMDAATLKVSLTPGANSYVLLGANSDLWTALAGYNQDLGISVSIDSGPDYLIAWKESGGFAGTFSPNAAFVHAGFAMASGHTYLFKLKWKTNIPQPAGAQVRSGAGLGPQFSPTILSVQLISG
jgi:outer membrane protein assembly factor BamB